MRPRPAKKGKGRMPLPRALLALAPLLLPPPAGAAPIARDRDEWEPLRDAIDAFAAVPDVLSSLETRRGPASCTPRAPRSSTR